MTTRNQNPLNKDIHIRIHEDLQKMITDVAAQNCIKESTFCRIVLERTIPQYTRNRFFGG